MGLLERRTKAEGIIIRAPDGYRNPDEHETTAIQILQRQQRGKTRRNFLPSVRSAIVRTWNRLNHPTSPLQ